MNAVEKLLTPEEAAEALGVKVQTLANWRQQKRGPAVVKIASNKNMYDPADIRAWIEQKKVKHDGSL